MKGDNIKIKDLVLIGGGHSHAMALKMLGMKPIPGIQITLITRDIDTPYSGMLPGYVAGLYEKDECYIDLSRMCRFADARMLHCSACGLDTEKQLIHCDDGRPPVRYDILSIDIGITPKTHSNNIMQHVNITAVKPIDRFGDRWEGLLHRLHEFQSDDVSSHKYTPSNPLKLVVVGGGAGGIELSMAMKSRLKKQLGHIPVKITICTRGERVMAFHGRNVQDIICRILQEKDIEIIYNASIIDAKVEPDGRQTLVAEDGRSFDFDEAIWCTQAQGQAWVKESGLQTTDDGFICVQSTLESVNTRNIFAAGDIAHYVDHPRPKAGVFAVRAAAPLVENLRRRFLHQSLEAWIPQGEFLGIIGTGEGYGIASKGGMGVEGAEMWKLKDKIDRQWMEGLQAFPDMNEMMKQRALNAANDEVLLSQVAQQTSSDTLAMLFRPKMRCGGCGSKVGSQILTRALDQVNRLYPYTRDEVINQTGDDAALVYPPKPSASCQDPILVHTIDYIKTCTTDPFLLGKVAAIHSLSDIFAMNATPISALALCVVPLADEDIMVDRLQQLLAGIKVVLQQEQCSLVGGHTSEGVDLAVGLSVTGVADRHKILPKGPLSLGYKLILTKALGTGVLLAADMELKARGRWVAGAIANSLQSNRQAASILSSYHASACTDVTGFGLLGHLLEMLRYESSCRVGVELVLDDIPILDGAIECVQMGVSSSLMPQNIRSARAVKDSQKMYETSSVYPILFDPQTSGGLLAAVPVEYADDAIIALHKAGYTRSSFIGQVIDITTISSDDTEEELIYFC